MLVKDGFGSTASLQVRMDLKSLRRGDTALNTAILATQPLVRSFGVALYAYQVKQSAVVVKDRRHPHRRRFVTCGRSTRLAAVVPEL
jgi:hypothetical protein